MHSCYGDRGGVKTFQAEAQRLEMECGWKQCVLWGMGVASSHMGQVGREREMKPWRWRPSRPPHGVEQSGVGAVVTQRGEVWLEGACAASLGSSSSLVPCRHSGPELCVGSSAFSRKLKILIFTCILDFLILAPN